MADITVTCPAGHENTITDPNDRDEQIVGVVDGVEQYDSVHHDTVIVKCAECGETFEQQIGGE